MIISSKPKNMISVGLSGNRYSGKDRVSKLFSQISVPVFHADIVLRFIINYNYELQNDIVQSIGYDYFTIDGKLDTNKIKDESVFNKVIDIVESDLFEAYKRFCNKNGSVYTIFHSSILFERGWHKKFDYNINVFAPTNDRLERCKRLTNKTISSIYKLAEDEMKDLEKNRLSNFVVHNYNKTNLSIGDTLTQVNKIDQEIIDEYLKNETKFSKKNFAL
jgi:dephospho-CoA kinase